LKELWSAVEDGTPRKAEMEFQVDPEKEQQRTVTRAEMLLQLDGFRHFISAVILIHTLAMASDTDEETELPRPMIIWIYYFANAAFACEILLHYLAADCSLTFFKTGFYLLEVFLVCCGVAGLVTGNRILLLLPSIRVLRLCKYSSTLQDLLEDCVATQHSFISLMGFVAVVGFCFAVVGRYIFRNEMDPISRSNFGDLKQAMLTIFQLFTGDQWR
jgi:hypothetical protein